MYSTITDHSSYFDKIKSFTSFLIDEHLDGFAKEVLEIAQAAKLPLVAKFSQIDNEDFFSISKTATARFLNDLSEGTSLEAAHKAILKWKSDQLTEVKRSTITAADIALHYSVRKQALLSFLPFYTKDAEEVLGIMKGLGLLFLQIEQKAFNTSLEIQEEIALEEKEFSTSILDNSIDGILSWNSSLIITAWNSVLEKNNKINRREAIGKNVFDLFPAYKQSEEGQTMKRVLNGEKIHFPEIPYLHKEGYFELNMVPCRNSQGKITGGISIIHDITERKKSEKIILEHQKKLQSTVTALKDQREKLTNANNVLVDQKIELEEKNTALKKEIEQRLSIEKELKKERGFIEAILNNMREGIAACDEEGKLSFFNEATKKFHGLPSKPLQAEEWPGYYQLYQPDGTMMKPKDVPLVQAFSGKKVRDMEMVVKSTKGVELILLANGQPIMDTDDKKLGAVVVMHDISERKKAEEHLMEINSELEHRVQERTSDLVLNQKELKRTLEQTIRLNQVISERENFLSNIIDQTPVSTAIFDAQGTQIQVNQACLSLFGVEDANSGLRKYNVLKDEYLRNTPAYPKIKAVFEEGKIVKFTTDYDLSKVEHVDIPSGKPVTVVTTVFPIKDAAGCVKNVVIQHEDITEKKQAEEALKASEEQLRLITDALPVLIAYVDKDERYRFNNAAYEDWFKFSRKEIYGKTIREVVGEEIYASLQDSIKKVLEGEEHYQETYLSYKGTGPKYIAVNYIPHVVSKKVIGFYALINDISKQKEIQRALEIALQETNDKNEELLKINTDLDNFIYIASHDLKSPIVNLEGLMLALNKLFKEKYGDKEKEIMNLMDLSIDKFKKTILDLTEVTKAQRNLEEDKENLNIPEAIEEVKQDIREMLTVSNAEIIEELRVQNIFFSKVNLKSIIYNLLSNAIKYRRLDVPLRIEISSGKEDSNIFLSVKDNGLGLSPNQQSKLFTMFKRMHNHVEGSGIGLYILKRLVENNGGKVEVKSKVNKGTEFKVYFKDYLA